MVVDVEEEPGTRRSLYWGREAKYSSRSEKKASRSASEMLTKTSVALAAAVRLPGCKDEVERVSDGRMKVHVTTGRGKV